MAVDCMLDAQVIISWLAIGRTYLFLLLLLWLQEVLKWSLVLASNFRALLAGNDRNNISPQVIHCI